MTTLKELAKALDLSITTVSRALAGYSEVAAETRERVREAAKAQGYQPNFMARRLKKGRTEAIALVLPTEPGHFDEPLFLEMIVAIGRRLAQADLDLVVMAARSGTEEQKVYRRLVEGKRADAAIVVRPRRRDWRIRYLADEGFPFVIYGRSDEPGEHAFVDGDGEAAFNAATTMLVSFGHRNIALINAPSHYTFAHVRAKGWRAALAAAGLPPGPVLVAESSEEEGYRLMRELLALEPRPTAVLCATDRMAIGAMRAIADAGLRAGRDIALIGHDNISAASYTEPPLTTLALPIQRTGERLVEILLALLDGAAPTDFQEIRPVTLIERDSHWTTPDKLSQTRKGKQNGGDDAEPTGDET